MRCFFFSYTGQGAKGGQVNGNIFMNHNCFPSNNHVKDEILRINLNDVNPESIVIMSIFEFKNEADFREFLKGN